MKIERPRFELTRVYADGTKESPEIVPVTEMPWGTRMNRRGVLGVGIGAAAALFLTEARSEASTSSDALPGPKRRHKAKKQRPSRLTARRVPGAEKTHHPPRSRGRRSGGGGGGYRICTCNKVCTCIPVPSDRNAKEAFATTDPSRILQRLSELPIQTWNYKWDDTTIRHIGPMAQDFAAAFAVGEDDKHICPVDAQGVAFAAIQGLYGLLQEKQAQADSLRARLQIQQKENQALNARIEVLERLVRDALARSG